MEYGLRIEGDRFKKIDFGEHTLFESQVWSKKTQFEGEIQMEDLRAKLLIT